MAKGDAADGLHIGGEHWPRARATADLERPNTSVGAEGLIESTSTFGRVLSQMSVPKGLLCRVVFWPPDAKNGGGETDRGRCVTYSIVMGACSAGACNDTADEIKN